MSTLKRTLGLRDLILIVIGTVIGSGIFLVPSTVLRQTGGDVRIALGVWLVAGVLSLLGALTYGEMGAAKPEAGGLYAYIRDAFGPLPAFLYGWTAFFVISSGSVATLAVAFTSYLQQFVAVSPLVSKVVAVLVILVVMGVNVRGVRQGADLQNVTTVIKAGAIVVMSAILLAMGRGDAGTGPASSAVPGPEMSLVAGVGLAMIAVLWAYEGWQYATFSAGETVNPQKTFPRAIVLGTAVLIGIYLVANLAYLAALGVSGVMASDRVAADAVSAVLGPAAGKVIAAVILVSMFSAANGITLTAPRLYFAMARDRVFFAKLAEVHPRFGTPALSIVASSLWAMLLALSGTFEQLLTYVVFIGWIFYALGALAVFAYRRREPHAERPFRTPGYPVTPLLFVASAVAIVLNTIVSQPGRAAVGLGMVLIGVPVYYAWRAKNRAAISAALLAAVIGGAASPAHAQTPSTSRRLVIESVTVVDVSRGQLLRDRTVVIDGDRIASVGAPGVRTPAGARVVSGRGKYLIPGLVDSHAHTYSNAPWAAREGVDTVPLYLWLVANGVTGVRDASGAGNERELVRIRDRIDRGEMLAPRLYVSGTASVRNVGRHGAADLADLVRRLAGLRVDGIKVIHLTREETLAAAAEARRAGLPVYGHTHVAGGIQRRELPFGFTSYAMDAIRGGLSGVMHATSFTPTPSGAQEAPRATATPEEQMAQFDEALTRALEGWLTMSEATQQALIDSMVARGTWLEPTLVVDDVDARPDRYAGHRGEALTGVRVAEQWGLRSDTAMSRRRQAVMARVGDFVRRFHAAGGLVLAGTDNAPLAGFGMTDELALLVAAGLSPTAALQAATVNQARALGRADRLGTVEAGKLADLVLLDADPLADVRNTGRVHGVVLNGRYLDRGELDEIRRRAKVIAEERAAERR